MKILLFDDHELFAKSLELVLAPHLSYFKSYSSPENIEAIVAEENPDIVILDIHMGAYSGLEIGRLLRDHLPHLKIVFLSGYNLLEYNREAQRMGANGFLEKNSSVADLVENLKLIYDGQDVFVSEGLSKAGADLTVREKEILQLMSNGDTQQAIADALGISRRTVNNHLMAINEKLDVNSSLAAVVKGVELGFVKLSNNR